MEVQQQFGEEVTIIGVPSLSDEAAMQRFIDETGTDVVRHIPDFDGEIWARFGVTQQHTYVFIDDDGSWRVAGYGSLPEDVEGLLAS